MTVEEEMQRSRRDKSAGGGGGGGRDEKEDVTQGDLAGSNKESVRPPVLKAQNDDFELKMPPPSTEGNKLLKRIRSMGWTQMVASQTSLTDPVGRRQGSGVGTGQGLDR